jgi:hypothetical protein
MERIAQEAKPTDSSKSFKLVSRGVDDRWFDSLKSAMATAGVELSTGKTPLELWEGTTKLWDGAVEKIEDAFERLLPDDAAKAAAMYPLKHSVHLPKLLEKFLVPEFKEHYRDVYSAMGLLRALAYRLSS